MVVFWLGCAKVSNDISYFCYLKNASLAGFDNYIQTGLIGN
ncbi:hypothetical protein [uncultured Gammaproteobacteria bacterium]|nr:hypothetical protein [uncultured Gammaproteobacteria bacterium]SHN93916.1 hypothetical protein BCLUESOX_1221 [bacterium endosymbiont of Bathymodiolus sp. 5 South]CAC9642168.1 hypothetical protein [uncultured Gammaproteobacteria bacterium]CAC9652314.1 hypothetical protein [uncultured Gammaproteobacteria bacterium]SSC09270.1 hypothetical protein BTURTLESOX_347 [bacterium endosymbiont of Bathymodiolus sp. 5 South]